MESDSPKSFEKTTTLVPLKKCGISSLAEFRQSERETLEIEFLKEAGLLDEDIRLYRDNEAGLLDKHSKMNTSALKEKLQHIYTLIDKHKSNNSMVKDSTFVDDSKPSTSRQNAFPNFGNPIYPEGHPMNSILSLENSLFGHLVGEPMDKLSKRRKILRRLNRKQSQICNNIVMQSLQNNKDQNQPSANPKSLWDVKEVPTNYRPVTDLKSTLSKKVKGPQNKNKTIYTIRDSKIVRLEPENCSHEVSGTEENNFRIVDIILPINRAEERLLEGTKLCIDEIRKIERFKDYEPGVPSRVLYLKNISPAATLEDISLLFNQFIHENQGPIDVRLLSGRMRGQAFARFQFEHLAIRALEDLNGTVVKGRPLIVQFGRNNLVENND